MESRSSVSQSCLSLFWYLALSLASILIWPHGLGAQQQQFALSAPGSLAQEDSSYHRTWQVGGYGMGGWAPNYYINGLLNYQEGVLYSGAGFEAGRMLTQTHGIGPLRWRAEAVVQLEPFWLSHEPRQEDFVRCCGGTTFDALFPGNYYHGVAATPALLRWNFVRRSSSRLVPYAQGGIGLLWTTKIYPQNPRGSFTSRFNFTPQFGLGESFFVRKNQSIDLGARFVHTTSWGLGEYNPGITSLQFTAGYSWWK